MRMPALRLLLPAFVLAWMLHAQEPAGTHAATAVRKLQQAIAAHPGNEVEGRERVELLRIYEKGGDWWNALDQLTALHKLNPNESEYAYQSGVVYRNLSQWAFERMQAVAPRSARFQQALGEHYSVTGDWADAVHAYRQALQLDPKLEGSHLALALICLRTGKPSEALVELNSELAIAPESAVARNLKDSIAKGAAQ